MTKTIEKQSVLIGRSSHPNVFKKEALLKNFAKFIGNSLYHGCSFNRFAGCRPGTLLKRASGISVFLCILRGF